MDKFKNNFLLYKAIVSYQGTYFHGWQSQLHKNTVQDHIEGVLYTLFKYKQKIIGASRTDSGVHAYGQVFTFQAPKEIERAKLISLLNNNLADTVFLRSIEEVETTFHPRYLSTAKVYQYLFSLEKTLPNKNFFVFHHQKVFDRDKFLILSRCFIGTHDFRLFSFVDQDCSDTIRTIYDIHLDEKEDVFVITIVGNGFLRYMIRKILGFIFLYLEKSNSSLLIRDIFDKKSISNQIPVFPAKGLLLKDIHYKENFIIDYKNPFIKE